MEDRLAAGIQETNPPLSGRVVAKRLFVLPALADDEIKPRRDQMLAQVRGMVGEERWPLVEARPPVAGLGAIHIGGSIRPLQATQQLEVSGETDDQGTLKVGWFFGGDLQAAGYRHGDLAMFLPEGDPNRTSGSVGFGAASANALRQRAFAWLQEQATARLGKKEKP